MRTAYGSALAWALIVCWALTAADWFCADAQLDLSVVNLTTLACVGTDIAGELRFRQRHGALAPVWPVHRLYVLPGMLEALETAGIPAFPRGRHYRTLWNFLAPFTPVDILVPVQHQTRAEEILRPLSGSTGQVTVATR